MKKAFLFATTLIVSMTICAQNIKLPIPDTSGGLPINKALAERHSVRSFDSSKAISIQTVSNLLWAACGINRAESNMRTNPTARNFQEIDAYWFDQYGVYRYNPEENALFEIFKGDYRNMIAGADFKQDFVLEAPASIVLVADTTKSGLTAALIDAGIACENINLFCAGNGLATVPRMTMDVNGIQKLLSLPGTSLPVLNNPIGYEKQHGY